MGTNIYLIKRKEHCLECGDGLLHIGKYSNGELTLRLYPEKMSNYYHPYSKEMWLDKLNSNTHVINEYGEPLNRFAYMKLLEDVENTESVINVEFS